MLVPGTTQACRILRRNQLVPIQPTEKFVSDRIPCEVLAQTVNNAGMCAHECSHYGVVVAAHLPRGNTCRDSGAHSQAGRNDHDDNGEP
jgi:hypothetical protein